MNLQTAIETLEIYNAWRKGEDVPQPKPKQIGKAIDLCVTYHSKRLNRYKIRDQFIDLIKKHGKLSVPEIAERINYSPEQVQQEVKILMQLNKVKRKKGKQKNGRKAYLYEFKNIDML